MKALVTGGRGMLARALRDRLPEAVYLGRDELDITSQRDCEEVLAKHAPSVVFNLAAYTKVDQAEIEEGRATAINGTGAGHLARACRLAGARMLHVSTDYVFDGSARRPWVEEDPVGPLSAYGRSKLVGEELVEHEQPDSLIVRTAWLYGAGGPNFVDTMLRLAGERDEIRVVDDQIGSPTWTVELAEALVELAAGGFRGLCQFTCAGQTSWYGFAQRILQGAGYRGKLVPIPSTELQRPAPRPAFSVLDHSRYTLWTTKSPRSWETAVDAYLDHKLGPVPVDGKPRI